MIAGAVLASAALLGFAPVIAVHTRQGARVQYTRVPDIAVVPRTGARPLLLVVWRDDATGASGPDMGTLGYAVSIDDGASWSASHPLMPADPRFAYVGAQLFVRDGVLNAFVERTHARAISGDDGVRLVRRVASIAPEGAVAWADAPMRVDVAGSTIANTKPFAFGGRFYLGFHRNTHVDGRRLRDLGVLVSDDLSHWRLDGMVPQPTSPTFLQEGWLSAGPEGLTITMRTNRGVAYVSQRGLAGWSRARAEPILPNDNSKPVRVIDGAGELYLYNRFADGGQMAEATFCDAARQTLAFRVRAAGGVWREGVLASSGVVNTYPSAERIGPGTYDIVWEQDYMRILFTRVALDQLPPTRPAAPVTAARTCGL